MGRRPGPWNLATPPSRSGRPARPWTLRHPRRQRLQKPQTLTSPWMGPQLGSRRMRLPQPQRLSLQGLSPWHRPRSCHRHRNRQRPWSPQSPRLWQPGRPTPPIPRRRLLPTIPGQPMLPSPPRGPAFECRSRPRLPYRRRRQPRQSGRKTCPSLRSPSSPGFPPPRAGPCRRRPLRLLLPPHPLRPPVPSPAPSVLRSPALGISP
jgi:hypothetical protein